MSKAPSWRANHLLLAPHRLGFFLGMVVLVAASAWWALVQSDRATGVVSLRYAMSPSLVHGAVMSLGFMPLFFSGFLFTAGPKWLQVQPPVARQMLPAVLLQAVGWLLWLVGAHVPGVALGGLACAVLGQAWVARDFWRLLRRSRMEDRLHARGVAIACAVSPLSLLGLWFSLFGGADALALVWIQTGLWGGVVAVFVVVADRMIPFFSSSVLPQVEALRPNGVLELTLTLVALEVLSLWLNWAAPSVTWQTVWVLLHGALALVGGAALLVLAGVWAWVRGLKSRLLVMLYVGFVWLGVSWALKGGLAWVDWYTGRQALPLGALHALTMGSLSSLFLAMVTRVSAGHSGRAQLSDTWVWVLFWILQCATLLRLLSAVPGVPAVALLLWVAASAWLLVMLLWAGRLMGWYGRQRNDGRPG